MSLNIGLNYNETIPNINVTTSLSTGSAFFSNNIATTSTISTLLNTTNLIALGAATIGNLFMTGGNIGIGTTSPNHLLTVNGITKMNLILGNTITTNTYDTLYLGTSSQGNFFLDRPLTAGQLIMGYRIPRPTGQFSPLTIYNNSTDREVLLACRSAGTSSGTNSVYIGHGFSNIPMFLYEGGTGNRVTGETFLTGGSVAVDNRSGFAASTGIYTIPYTGYYQISYFIRSPDGHGNRLVAVGPPGATQASYAAISADPTGSVRRSISFSTITYYTTGSQVSLIHNGVDTFSLNVCRFGLHLVNIV